MLQEKGFAACKSLVLFHPTPLSSHNIKAIFEPLRPELLSQNLEHVQAATLRSATMISPVARWQYAARAGFSIDGVALDSIEAEAVSCRRSRPALQYSEAPCRLTEPAFDGESATRSAF